MDRVSRPLLGLLVASVLVLVLWIVALKPSSSSSTGGAVGQYQPAINAAHNAVANSVSAAKNAQNAGTTASSTPAPAASSAPATTTPAASTPAASTPAASTPAASTPAASTPAASTPAASTPTTASASATATQTPKLPQTPQTATARANFAADALRSGKVLALVFYNPAAPDDRAVARYLRTIPSDHGQVVSLAVPVTELSNYQSITNSVPVSVSPTLVFIDRARQATTIVGYASRYEIAQRVANALAVTPVAPAK